MNNRQKLKKVYDRTNGYCHICHKKLSLCNYGILGLKGAWHIEHSKAKANGGSDHLNNLYAACIECNFKKGTKSTRTMRRRNSVSRAPYNKEKREAIKNGNTVFGMLTGGAIGSLFGPGGVIICSVLGELLGEDLSPKR